MNQGTTKISWKEKIAFLLEKILLARHIHNFNSKRDPAYKADEKKLAMLSNFEKGDIHMKIESVDQFNDELLQKANHLCANDEWRDGVKYYDELYSIYPNVVAPDCFSQFVEILVKKKMQTSKITSDQNGDFLKCKLCFSVLHNPITLDCGHSFCKKCAEGNLPNACVICGASYESQILNLNVSLDAIIQHLRPKEYESAKIRTEGNNLFSAMDFSNCLQKYTESIALDEESHLSLSNRSHVNSLLGQFEESLQDADKIIHLKPNWLKGHYRRGIALLGLGRNEEAALSFFNCTRLNLSNKSVKHCLYKALHDMLLSYTLHMSQDSGDERSTCSDEELEDQSVDDDDDATHPLLSFVNKCLGMVELCSGGEGNQVQEISQDKEQFPPAPPETVCVLCARFIYDPVTTPCGHVCCLTCLDRSLDHRPYCPVCRAELHEHVTLRKKNVTEVLNTIIQTCWPEDYRERKQQHDEEMESLARVAEDSAEVVPIFVCTPALPSVLCLLHVFEPRYRLMMRQCMESGSQQFGMSAYNPQTGFANYGTMLVIRELQYLPDGRSLVDSIGGRRFKVLDRGMKDGYNTAQVEWIKDEPIPENEKENVKLLLQFVYAHATNWIGSLPRVLQNRIEREHGSIPANDESLDTPNGPAWMWWMINILPMEVQKQVEFIGTTTLQSRISELQRILFNLTNM